jgi:DNA-binding CsgD family transcriptional regulator
VSAALAAYALGAADTINYARVYYFVLVGAVAVVVAFELLEVAGVASTAVATAISWLISDVAFLAFALACHEGCLSVGVMFGAGYALLFLSSTLGQGAGMTLRDAADVAGIDAGALVMSVGYLGLLAVLVVFRPSATGRFAVTAPVLRAPGVTGLDAEELARACQTLAAACGLTPREEEVLELLAAGDDAADVAERLSVSMSTTRTHIRNIYTKLDVHSKKDLSARVAQTVC